MSVTGSQEMALPLSMSVAGIGGNAVNTEGVVSKLDLVEFCAVQKVLHSRFSFFD